MSLYFYRTKDNTSKPTYIPDYIPINNCSSDSPRGLRLRSQGNTYLFKTKKPLGAPDKEIEGVLHYNMLTIKMSFSNTAEFSYFFEKLTRPWWKFW